MMRLKSALLFLTVIIVILSLPISAADSTVTYRGLESGFTFAPGSSYTNSDLFDNFKGVMPGDERTETITVKNSAHDCDYIRVYLKALPHDEVNNPLSESVAAAGETVASMSDFLAQLSMTVKNGDEVIFEESPDKLDGFEHPVYIGTVRRGETIDLDVTLSVPIELGNEYAYRVGEVDWVFHIEAFNDPHLPIFPVYPQPGHNIIVNKIWADGGIAHPDSIEVNLLRDGVVYDTVKLSESNNWSYAWANVEKKYDWSVEEVVPEGYIATYKTDATGMVTTIVNTKVQTDKLTVEKVWEDEDSADRPKSVDIVLLRDGKYYKEAALNADNDWTHTWDELSVNNSWSVLEKKVPDGYYVSYSYDKAENKVIVKNTLEEPETTSLTVNKVWVGDNGDHPQSIMVSLLKDGKQADYVEISESDNWTYTWKDLPAEYNWSVTEDPVDGYLTEYASHGNEVTITNTKIIVHESYSITVKKVWSDSANGKDRPTSAEAVLYNGETAVEAVLLGEWNNWTYTWKDLDVNGNWRVTEDNVPKGYTPSYTVEDGVVTITNTETLIQTGQLNWPILVFGGLGIIILIIGILLLWKKKEKENA